MAFTSRTQLFVAVLFFSLLSHVIGHSYVTSPMSRGDQAMTETGCRGPACLGPCDKPLSAKVRAGIDAQRGDSITVQWPRNNHAGGFIRFAWAPTADSDNAATFDANIQQINCHEVGGCHPDDPSNPNGGDSGPADGSSRACTSVIQVPLSLTDGDWTLQWAWFGGAFALGDYYSCVDYTISGGPQGEMTPVFKGGDYSNPDTNVCKFFNTNELGVCVNEPCQTPLFLPASSQQTGIPADGQLGAGVPILAAVSSSTGDSTVIDGQGNNNGNDDDSSSTSSSSSSSSGGDENDGSSSSSSSGDSNDESGSSSTSGDSDDSSTSSSSSSSGDVDSSSSTSGDADDENGSSSSGSYGDSSTTGSSSDSNGSDASTSSDASDSTSTSTGASDESGSSSSSTSGSTSGSTSSDDDSCTDATIGHERCIEGATNQYQTCSPGRDAPSWSGVQYCQQGLSCHTDPVDGSYIWCME